MVGSKYLVDDHLDVVLGVGLDSELAAEKAAALGGAEKVSDVVVVDSLYPYIGYDGALKQLPAQAKRMYGCHNCEWRGSKMCPFGIARKASAGVRTSHSDGICEMRVNYLKNFYRGVRERPSYTEWVNDFNQGLAQLQLQDDWVKLKRIEERLEEFDGREAELSVMPGKDESDSVEGAEFKALQALRSRTRSDWFFLLDKLMTADDKRITRETPKKLDVVHSTMSLSDIHKIMREDNIVEAEFEEVTEKKEEE